ncbi:proton-conducting transporter membrane subunit [Desulfosporosinus sp. FKB]|uniref:proton-conducting transporter transmembrane domain-containing protein n=1 Tax=Desulfosporosinus sp. FKB TaxID=1969835 RepID=UPI000B49B134|nr:proton-conducting transporter membrane subunit [Desulfosporosinus sp. FKB]
MELYVRNLFLMSVLLYVLGAAASALIYFFRKPDKTGMTGSFLVNAFCIVASGLGGAAAVAKILFAVNPLELINLSSAIPFISLEMNLDNLSAFFVLALSVLVFSVSIYSIGYLSHYNGKRNIGLFNLLYTMFILAMIGVLTSANTVCFYIFWEAMSLFSYFLVVFEAEKEENTKAGTVYIVMTHIATALLLIGFVIIYSYTKSFALNANTMAIPGIVKNIVFVLFLIGFGTKAGVIPLHIWLPHAHPAAPSNVSALMSGIMIKTAIYGLVRFVLCYLGIQNTWWGIVILILGVLSAVLGVAYALMEHNIKRLLAFHSVENIGIILIGLGVSFIAFAQHHQIVGGLALTAALLHTFNHTLFKGGLFLGAGAIQYAAHTKNIEDLGGLIKTMPLTALFVLCFSLAISAIVPFNGFVSEWLTYQSLFANILPEHIGLNFLAVLAVAALALTGALAAACFVKLFGISFLGLPRSEQAAKAQDVPATMTLGMGILAALCLGIGLFPLTMIKLLDKVVFSVGGGSIYGQLQGGFMLAYYPLTISVNSISPLAFILALGAIILLALIVIRIVGGKYIERRYGTWDCGFEALNSRMQYSATGFSKPIKIVFRALFRPVRKTIVEGDSMYHPESIMYSTTVTSIFEDYLYEPLYRALLRFSKRTKFRVQTGSIHNYLLYIFALVLLLMLYNRFA